MINKGFAIPTLNEVKCNFLENLAQSNWFSM